MKEIGVIGLGVMGKSLSRNLARNGFKLSLFNRHVDGVEENVASDFVKIHAELNDAAAFDDIYKFVQSIETPRKIILMVNAGAAVDAVLDNLEVTLEEGDIVVDGGNSHFEDTNRRISSFKEKGLFFIGSGISGGEEGALNGPSIMPSGDQAAYLKVQKYLESIAAKDVDGNPCCTYIGNGGSGHFVKMIHNGIEYAEMQLLAECYSVLKRKKLSNEEIASVFESWMTDLGGYLLGITVNILRKKEDNEYILDSILDKAGNKGTGKWASVSIADSGQPSTLIPSALFARYLSFFKETRVRFSQIYATDKSGLNISELELKEAYQFARVINHYQGFMLIKEVSNKNDWNVNLSEVSRIWTAGCIIKSDFMSELVEMLNVDVNFLLDPKFISIIKNTYSSIKSVASECIKSEVYAPCMIDAVNYFNGLKTAHSSANIIQAQRDYFGAHTYQREGDSSEEFYHTEWDKKQ